MCHGISLHAGGKGQGIRSFRLPYWAKIRQSRLSGRSRQNLRITSHSANKVSAHTSEEARTIPRSNRVRLFIAKNRHLQAGRVPDYPTLCHLGIFRIQLNQYRIAAKTVSNAAGCARAAEGTTCPHLTRYDPQKQLKMLDWCPKR
jgi:hypothetical protein